MTIADFEKAIILAHERGLTIRFNKGEGEISEGYGYYDEPVVGGSKDAPRAFVELIRRTIEDPDA